MKNDDLILKLYENISINPIIKKYNQFYQVDLISLLNLKERLRFFSGGKLYLYLTSLHSQINTEHLRVSAEIEIFCLASKILDDLLDEDSKYSLPFDEKNHLLFFSELLTHSMRELSLHPKFPEANHHLQDAINAEFNDVNLSPIINKFSDNDYRNIFLPKTSSIINFISDLSGLSLELSQKFSKSFSFSLQITNDLNGIIASSEKSDIKKVRPTLPIIMALNSKHGREVFSLFQNHDFEAEDVKTMILQSGAMEYCSFHNSIEKENISSVLIEAYPDQRQTITFILEMLEGVSQ